MKEPIALRANTAELFLLARLRDEAHRFANTFHRERRGKAMLRSALDDIPGIGKARRTALLKHFGTVAAIAAASPEELAKAPGMNKASAAAVRDHFLALAASAGEADPPAPDDLSQIDVS